MSDKKSKSEKLREEMWETFFQEVEDLLEKLESQLLDIENDGNNNELIAALFRTMHTFKGTSGMMGLVNLQDLAHYAEDVMDLVRNDKMELTEHTVDLLFKTLDHFTEANDIIRSSKKDIERSSVQELIGDFKEVLSKIEQPGGQNSSTTGDKTPANSPNNNSDNTEIDDEYVDAFFELVWENHKLVKKALPKLKKEVSQEDGFSEIKGYCEEWINGAEHIGLKEVVDAANHYIVEIQKHFGDIKALAADTNHLSHLFWELEESHKAGTLNLTPPDQGSPSGQATSNTNGSSNDSLRNPFADLWPEFFNELWKTLGSLRKSLKASEPSSSLDDSLTVLNRFLATGDNAVVSKSKNATQTLITDLSESPRNIKQISKTMTDVYAIFWELEEEYNKFLELNPEAATQAEQTNAQSQGTSTDEKPKTSASTSPQLSLVTQPPKEPEQASTDEDEQDIDAPNALDNQDDISTQVFIEDYIDDIQSNLIEIREMITADTLSSNKDKCLEIIDHLIDRSDHLGLYNISNHIKVFLNIIKVDNFEISDESYNDFEITIYEHIAQMLDTYKVWPDHPNAKSLHVKNVFLQWHADKLFIYISECLSSFRSIQQTFSERGRLEDHEIQAPLSLISENIKCISYGCQHYLAQSIESMLLKLEDFLLRVQIKPELLTQVCIIQLIDFFTALGCAMNEIIDIGETDEEKLNDAFSPLDQQLHEHDDSLVDMASHFLHGSPNAPQAVKDGLNESELEKIAALLSQNRPIYLIFADLENDDNIALAVTNRLSGTDLTIITSVTDYIEDRSVFYFVVSPTGNAADFAQDIKDIDPEQTTCYSIALSNLQEAHQQEDTLFSGSALHDDEVAEKAGEVQNILGQLISIKSNMNQAGENVSQIDLFEEIDSLMTKHGRSWKEAREEVRSKIDGYESEIKGMLQAQHDFSLNLDKLQDNLDEIGQVNITELLDSISEWYESNLSQQGLSLKVQKRNGAVQTDKFGILLPILRNMLKSIVNLFKTNLEVESAQLELDIIPHDGSFIVNIGVKELLLNSTFFGGRYDSEKQVYNADQITDVYSELGLNDELIALEEGNFKQSLEFDKGTLISIKSETISDQRILDGIVVESQSNTFVFPIEFIKRIVNLSESEIVTASANDKQKMLKVGDELVPIRALIGKDLPPTSKIALVLEYMNQESAILIDELVGIRQVMTSPASSLINNNDAILGMTVLGKDSVGMVIDTNFLTQ